MRYDKEVVKSDGRRLLKGGPRDMQRRTTSSYDKLEADAVIETLRTEIRELRGELSNRPVNTGPYNFTAEQVDEEINKAVEQVVNEMNVELKKKDLIIDDLTNKISSLTESFEMKIRSLEEVVSSKTYMIEELKNKPINDNTALTELIKKQAVQIERLITSGATSPDLLIDRGRPVIDDVIIDPLDKDSGKHLESFISVEDLSTNKKEDTKGKVDKLKALLGKLPSN